jgi:hypothetical protein
MPMQTPERPTKIRELNGAFYISVTNFETTTNIKAGARFGALREYNWVPYTRHDASILGSFREYMGSTTSTQSRLQKARRRPCLVPFWGGSWLLWGIYGFDDTNPHRGCKKACRPPCLILFFGTKTVKASHCHTAITESKIVQSKQLQTLAKNRAILTSLCSRQSQAQHTRIAQRRRSARSSAVAETQGSSTGFKDFG